MTFSTPPLFRVAHVGLFWQRVRQDFPHLEEAVPLVRPGEVPSQSGIVELNFAGFPIPRTWMICDAGDALIQLQRDRLIYNWKAASNVDVYPSYDAVIIQFERHVEAFDRFLADEKIGVAEPIEYELTYVNHIPLDLLSDDPELLIDHVRRDNGSRFLPEPSRFHWSSVYPLPSEAGELQVSAQSVQSLSGEPLVKLDMVARGFPASEVKTRKDWFDLAHVWITKGFADITGPKTQKEVWERTS